MAEIGKVKGIVIGQYGQAISLTVVDKNGDAVDISTYTAGITVTLRDPFSLKTLTYSASFVTDGTNGQIQFTPSSGDIDRSGTWEGQITLDKATARARTQVFSVEIEKSLSAST